MIANTASPGLEIKLSPDEISAKRRIVLCSQIHYIEVPQGGILMEQKMRFGLVLGQLAVWG